MYMCIHVGPTVCAMLMISYVILKYAPYDWLKCNPRLQKKKIARGRGPAARGQSVHGSVYCAYKWGMSQTDDSPSLIGAACLAGRGRRFFFLQTRIAIPQYFSQSYGAYFKHIGRTVHTRTVNVCAMLMISYVILKYAPYDWLKCNPRLQKKKSRAGAGPLHVVSLFTAPFTARTSEACHRPMTHHRLSA